MAAWWHGSRSEAVWILFELFSDRARKSMVVAQDEARRLRHGYIGTEHLLLGLTDDPTSGAATAMESLGVSVSTTRTTVYEMVEPGEQVPTGHIPFTRPAKRSLEQAARASADLGHDYIGTEHLLLGLLQAEAGTAAQVLGQAGVGVDQLRGHLSR